MYEKTVPTFAMTPDQPTPNPTCPACGGREVVLTTTNGTGTYFLCGTMVFHGVQVRQGEVCKRNALVLVLRARAGRWKALARRLRRRLTRQYGLGMATFEAALEAQAELVQVREDRGMIADNLKALTEESDTLRLRLEAAERVVAAAREETGMRSIRRGLGAAVEAYDRRWHSQGDDPQ